VDTPPGRDGRPTLASLAQSLGVSRQTVSNVLNNPDIVHPRTRERVEQAIRASGYRRSAAGLALRTQRAMSIAVRLYPSSDGVNGAVMDRFVHELTTAAQRKGYKITLFTADDSTAEVAKLESLHRSGSIDLAVLTDTGVGDRRPAQLLAAAVPMVAFGRPWDDPDSPHCWVDIDGASGTRDATASLRRDGHTRIGFLGWPTGSGVGDDRRAGWRTAVADLPECADLELEVAHDDASSGAAGAAELKRRGATAVVCASDSLALGAVTAFREHQAQAGRILPVVGFDDTPVARALGLCSVRQPVELAASVLVEMAVELLNGQQPEQPSLLLEPELTLRPIRSFVI